MPDAAETKLIFAWCFSRGRLHIFTTESEPWCTALWVQLAGADRDEALQDKQARFGDVAFEHELSLEQRARIILGNKNRSRVQLHASSRQGVETCATEEVDVQKFGTGSILTDDTEEGRIVRTAIALTEAQRADIIDEGEEAETEGE